MKSSSLRTLVVCEYLVQQGDFEFVPLTNAQVTSLDNGTVRQLPFLIISKRHVRVAYPVEP